MKKRYTLLCYQSAEDLLWYWKLLNSSRRTLAHGAEGFESKTNLLKSAKRNKALNFDYIIVREEVQPVVQMKVNL